MQTKLIYPLLLIFVMAIVLAGCGGGATSEPAVPPTSAGNVAEGQILFQQSCAACHGMNAEGVPGLGKDMVHSDFVHGLSDAELVEFIKQGRSVSDPANTTGVDMPPKGGNPALSDAQLQDIVAFIRSLE